MKKNSKIFIAGHTGMVGSAILKNLESKGFQNLILRTSKELDLIKQSKVDTFFRINKPEYVFLAAARVGGILANNTYRAEFIYNNIQIATNVIHSAFKYKVKKLVFLSSSCIYPRLCEQPMKEESLWTGTLEPTNEPYAVAKLAGISLCQAYNSQYKTDFISVIPTNLYGINDNFDPIQSHLLAALILKFHTAKIKNDPTVIIWGTGKVKRELMFVDDAASAIVYLMNNYSGSKPVNIGTGQDLSIKEIALIVKKVVGYSGKLVFDATKPDGSPRKLLDISLLNSLGWKAKTDLKTGIKISYNWFLNNYSS